MLTASIDYENSLHECGHPLDESTSILADPMNSEGEWFYHVDLPMRCHACSAINQRRKEYDGDNYDPARLFSAEKVMRI